MEKKKKPNFNVLNFGFFKSVKSRWRKPRGTHNKKRMKFQWAGASPKIGYRNAPELRDLHPSGMKEVLVCNPAALEGLSGVVVRISSTVGVRKRAVMEEKARALKLRVVNASKTGEQPKFVPAGKKASVPRADKPKAVAKPAVPVAAAPRHVTAAPKSAAKPVAQGRK